ncbi:MAG: hypothetical protein ACK4NR_12325 [Micavibrio sp.]
MLLLAIIFQAKIPTGFMPGEASASSFMQICSADGPITVEVDHDGQPVKEHEKKKPCAFSLLSFADIPAVHAFAPVVFTALPQAIPEPDSYIGHYTIYLPPATAPPTLI